MSRRDSRQALRTESAASSGREIALAVAASGVDKKAQDIEIIDVRDKVDYTDYVVVMSGRSDRQVLAIARGIEEGVRERTGARCVGTEGLPHGRWVLIDFSDVIVHVFHHDTRGYYDLGSLWMDAQRLAFEPASAE